MSRRTASCSASSFDWRRISSETSWSLRQRLVHFEPACGPCCSRPRYPRRPPFAAGGRSGPAPGGWRGRLRPTGPSAPRPALPVRAADCCSSRMTLSALTAVPGRSRIRSTRPCVVAGIQRMSSGTSVPRPRTCRTIGPRLTVSGQSVAASTVGAAGRSRDRPTLTPATIRQADRDVTSPLELLLAGIRRPGNVHVCRSLDGKTAKKDRIFFRDQGLGSGTRDQGPGIRDGTKDCTWCPALAGA